MLNPSTGLPTHLDGAIRLYNEENILERIDKKMILVNVEKIRSILNFGELTMIFRYHYGKN